MNKLLPSNPEIMACLRYAYGLEVTHISPLPWGADFNTAVYRVTTNNGSDYFLKLRSGEFLEASVLVPQYLAGEGFNAFIPPLLTRTGLLWVNLGSFKGILYPFVEGGNGAEAKLSDDHWVRFGAAIKALHTADIPFSITKDVQRETFSSKWRESLKAFIGTIENQEFKEPVAAKAATFLKQMASQIQRMVKVTEDLALTIQKQPSEYVLCHGDMHGWNLIVSQNENLFIVDWDTLILAPKERDLMFVGAGIWDSGRSPPEDEELFYQGYGETEVSCDGIAYYRFVRVIQDIAEYCEHIFSCDDNDDGRLQCFEYLKSNFLPGGTIERAYESYSTRIIL